MPIGSYAKGCAAGLVELPETGPTWQAMRLSRNRNFGQPVMIRFLEDLSRDGAAVGWAGLYIGDISQPRGGPMTSGHASHQIGLDADIWMLPPRRLNLTRAERESISSIPVRSADQRCVTENWTRSHHALLRAAASDPRVDRIFVAAAVKIEMCKTAKPADKKWLQKIRPIAGHDTHFHVRLKCPKGARLCETQKPTVAELSKGGDGCDETLTWWVTDYLNPPKTGKTPKKPKTRSRARRARANSPWPICPPMRRRTRLALIAAAVRWRLARAAVQRLPDAGRLSGCIHLARRGCTFRRLFRHRGFRRRQPASLRCPTAARWIERHGCSRDAQDADRPGSRPARCITACAARAKSAGTGAAPTARGWPWRRTGRVYVSFEGAARVLHYAALDGPAENLPITARISRGCSAMPRWRRWRSTRDGTLYTLPEDYPAAAARPFRSIASATAAWDQPFDAARAATGFLPVGADFGPDGRLLPAGT